MSLNVGELVGYLRLDMGDFETGMAKGQALADKLDGKNVDVKVDADTAAAEAKLAAVAAAEKEVDRAGHDMQNNMHSRMGMIIGLIATLGPPLVAIAAGAAGLAVGFGAMGAAGILAVVGIVKEMKAGTPLGLAYTGMLSTLKGDLTTLGRTAASGVLGPFQQAVGDLQKRMPVLNSIVGDFSVITGRTAGVLTTGLVAAFIALAPLARDAGMYVLGLSTKFAAMMSGPGVVSFGDYVRSVFPQVMQAVESIVGAVVHLVAAIAPLGLGTLGILRTFTDLINALPIDVLAVLAQTASSVYLGFMAFKMLSGPLEKVSTALKFVGVSAETAAVGVRTLTIAAGVIGAIITVATLLYSAHAESVRKDQAAVNDLTDALRQSNGVLDENVRKVAYQSLAESGAIAVAKQYGISLSDVTSAALGNVDAQDRVTTAINEAKAASRGGEVASTQYGASLLGTTSALQTHTAGLGGATDASIAADQGLKILTGSITGVTGNLKTATQGWKDQSAATAASGVTTTAASVAQQALAAKIGTTAAALVLATTAQQTTRDAAAQAAAKMYLENDAAGILKTTLDLLNGETLNAAQAQNSFDSSLVNMGDHVNATGKKITFTTTSIKDMSSASVALRGQLNGQVTNLQAVVEANGGLANSTGKARAQMVTMRQQIIDNAVAHGVDRAAVTAYIDKLLKVPKSVPPTKLDVAKTAAEKKIADLQAKINAIKQGKVPETHMGTANALAQIRALQAKINALRGKNIAVNVNTHSYSTGPGGSGGPVAGAAGGGLIGRLMGLVGKAGGGAITGPGTSTSDSITGVDASGTPIVRVSRDEFVVNAAAYARNKALVNAINDGRQGFAGGGAMGGFGRAGQAGLAGLAIEGTLDLGNGLIGVMRGVVKSEMAESGAKLRYAGVS